MRRSGTRGIAGQIESSAKSLIRWDVILLLMAAVGVVTLPLSARAKDKDQYGVGVIVNVPFSQAEVAQVVQDVVQNGIIRGTKEYNKDQYITGANPASSTHVFAPWTEGGQVFYKVRLQAIDPRNFKNSGDVGTLAVRYVIQPQGDKNTILRIDARFVEDFRHVAHASNGSVESAEYKDIRDRLEAISVMKSQAIEAQKENLAARQKPADDSKNGSNSGASSSRESTSPELTDAATTNQSPTQPAPAPASPAAAGTASEQDQVNAASPPQTLEERIHTLRQKVERIVKSPGAPLKSAPFHTASVLQTVPAGTEVLIVVSTPYWFGVETHEGQHGWILRDELEQVP